MANAHQSPSPAKLEALNRAAKARFTQSYEGTIFEPEMHFHHRPVIRFMKRDYTRGVLDWNIATTLARAQLKSAEIASRIEQAMLAKVNDVKEHFTKQRDQMKMLADSSGLALKNVTHPSVHTEKVVLVGPVSVQMSNAVRICDEYLDYVALLYTFGVMDGNQASDAQFDVRNRLKGMSTCLRTHRANVLQKMREAGIVRPGYKSDDQAVEQGDAAQTATAGDQEASAVVPLMPQAPAAPVAVVLPELDAVAA